MASTSFYCLFGCRETRDTRKGIEILQQLFYVFFAKGTSSVFHTVVKIVGNLLEETETRESPLTPPVRSPLLFCFSQFAQTERNLKLSALQILQYYSHIRRCRLDKATITLNASFSQL